MAKKIWLILALLTLGNVIVGCREPTEVVVTELVEVTVEVVATVVVTATPSPTDLPPTATSTPTNTPIPTNTPPSIPTFTPTPIPPVAGEIVVLLNMPVLEPPAIHGQMPYAQRQAIFRNEESSLREWVLAAFEEDLDFYADVQPSLVASGWSDPQDLWLIDIENDDVDEWLITFQHPPEGCPRPNPNRGCSGNVWLVGNDGIEFQFTTNEDELTIYDWGPDVELRRLTPDSALDVVITTSGCGAHTCWENVYVVSSELGDVQHMVRSPTERSQWGKSIMFYVSAENRYLQNPPDNINMTYSEHAIIDINGDGRDEIIMEGGAAGSAGSGFQRLRTEVWGWNGEGIGLIDLIWHEATTRLHRLWEASDLYDMGRYDEAQQLFVQLVVERDSDEVAEYPPENQPERVANFAAFRLAVLAYQQNDVEAMTEWIGWLETNLEADHPYLPSARLLQQRFITSESLDAACGDVVDSLNMSESLGNQLPYEFGYANPSFQPSDLCPNGQPVEWGS